MQVESWLPRTLSSLVLRLFRLVQRQGHDSTVLTGWGTDRRSPLRRPLLTLAAIYSMPSMCFCVVLQLRRFRLGSPRRRTSDTSLPAKRDEAYKGVRTPRATSPRLRTSTRIR